MLPGDEAPLLKRTVVRIAGPPEGGGVGGDASDAGSETRARSIIRPTDGDVATGLEDYSRDVEADDGGIRGYEETLVTHVGVGRVEGYGFDGDEEFVWSWLWGGTGLDLEGLAFGRRDSGEVGGHFFIFFV